MIRIRLLFREPLFAETPFRLEVEVQNLKPFHSYSVSILPPFKLNHRLYLATVKKGISRVSFDNIIIERRGRYAIRDLRLMSGFPFIFMYLYKKQRYDSDVIVYPRIIDVSSFIDEITFSQRGAASVDREGEFLFIREYIPGEESRMIDWKATARMQKTMTRVFSKEREGRITIILDNSGGGSELIFEKAVSVTASLVSEFILRDYFVRLITCGKIVPFGKGKSHLFKILDILAGIKQSGSGRCPVDELAEGANLLVLCSDSSGFSHVIPQCDGVIDARDI